ncbi:class I SAM-dependent methyltransferase [Luteimonas sp. M1R5S18]|uniref:Class I SAM-dependent methyltransferase n=1 Tax=Luteimonas rhizosphaericola TaxID=3042024 RepID=A0ABT6JMW2_9GAMM|nr:class I SAM-dependent methyltransferase [Luteimonas rhizosphaericola]MDH5831321.1 class I SAM-dependent methyltransferase [Luteimonas rhizosphaericola]
MMDATSSRLVDPIEGRPLSRDGEELVSAQGQRYPILAGVPRFVPAENYAQAFGEQWVRFPRTQLDSATGLTLSRDRLERCLGHPLAELSGQLVLEAGSGAGRFTELLLQSGATLDSFDYSGAVAANAANNGAHPKLCLVQADVRQMPFLREAYDLVVCLGVVQHTPDPEETLRALWSRVRPGGRLVFDHYRAKVRNYLPPPLGTAGIVYRRYFLSLPREKRFDAVKRVVDRWFPLIWKYRENYPIQFLLSRLNPVVNYYPHFGLTNRQMYYEWMLLDTHDAMTDVYKHRRTARSLRRFLGSLGAEEVNVWHGGNGVEASCRKPREVSALNRRDWS